MEVNGLAIINHIYFFMTLLHHRQRINDRSGIHPQLHPESNQEPQITVFGGKRRNQQTETKPQPC